MHRESVLIAGGTGLVGGALVRRLKDEPNFNVVAPMRAELNLLDSNSVASYLRKLRPETVVLAAALVGGIGANRAHPVAFLTDNLAIQNNVMMAAHAAGVRKLMFLGSSCIYPRDSQQPMREEFFMTGRLEPTNESYAVAKIAGIRLAEALRDEFGIRVFLPMPSNIYGPGDHFDPEKSHVLSSLVARFENARRNDENEVELWGTGSAKREFTHCDDVADACLFLLNLEEDLGIVNVGSGEDISILDLANLVKAAVGFEGSIVWDHSKPDGMPRKLLDVSRLNSRGWFTKIPLEQGIQQVVNEYRSTFPRD